MLKGSNYQEYSQSVEGALVSSVKAETEITKLEQEFEAQYDDYDELVADEDVKRQNLELRHAAILEQMEVPEEVLLDLYSKAPEQLSPLTLDDLNKMAEVTQKESAALLEASERAYSSQKFSQVVSKARKALGHDLQLFILVALGSFFFAKTFAGAATTEVFPTSLLSLTLGLAACGIIIYLIAKFRSSVFLKITTDTYIDGDYAKGKEPSWTQGYAPPWYFIGLSLFMIGLFWPLGDETYGNAAPMFVQVGVYLGLFVTFLQAGYHATKLKEFFSICWWALTPKKKPDKQKV